VPRIPFDRLDEFAFALLHAGGATEYEARLVGRSLVESNLRGYDSHGVMRIPYYVEGLVKGQTKSDVALSIVRETPTTIVADAQWGFGRVQCGRLTERLIEQAAAHGAGIGTMTHSSHIGRLGEYCELASERGFVSMMMVNSHGAARRVAPPGGKAPRLGTNPMAIGAPCGDTPLVLDFSTSATAEGKVRVKRIAGERCPPGWLLDADGRPTTDANALYTSPPGTILPMGGDQAYKGFGLAMMIDIFSGALSGGLCSRETPETPPGNCVFVMIADPDHFGGGAARFQDEVRRLADFVRSCPRIEGHGAILLPGDPERATRADRMANGIPLDEENWTCLLELAQDLTLPPPLIV